MHVPDQALVKALALSLLLHLIAVAGGSLLALPQHAGRNQAQLEVVLVPRHAPQIPDTPLFVDEAQIVAPKQKPAAQPHTRPRTPSALMTDPGRTLAGEAAQHANRQLARELFYPPEAIAQGLEGEALVLLFLNTSGDVIAARLETSSGHAILDDAAVRAARTLRSLPASAPREALLPVRFRLR